MNRGFSTLEIMMALFIMVIVLAGALSANFAAQYWSITSETSNEALYKAKTVLENYRATARADFYQASSSPVLRDDDASCLSGGLCYFSQSDVSDLSTCSKYVKTDVSWQVENYPTTTTSLFTNLTNIPETVALGGDCLLQAPEGDWSSISEASSGDFSPGNPTGLDVLNGDAFISTDDSPWLLARPATSTSFFGCSGCDGPYNALDVGRDPSTGRAYAYIAATTTYQFQIADVTDPKDPNFTVGVALSGTDKQAWRIAYYGQKVYITTRYLVGATPELYIFNVVNPYAPAEVGTFDLDTSPYDIVVRDQIHGGSVYRFAYLATTHDAKEVMILDVTDPSMVSVAATLDLPDTGCALADKPDATSLSLSGNTLFVGRDHSASCASLPSLYAINVANPFAPVLASQTLTGKTIMGLRVSGGIAYLETSSWANAPGTRLLDADGNSLYAVRPASGSTGVEAWNVLGASPVMLSSHSPLGHVFQALSSP